MAITNGGTTSTKKTTYNAPTKTYQQTLQEEMRREQAAANAAQAKASAGNAQLGKAPSANAQIGKPGNPSNFSSMGSSLSNALNNLTPKPANSQYTPGYNYSMAIDPMTLKIPQQNISKVSDYKPTDYSMFSPGYGSFFDKLKYYSTFYGMTDPTQYIGVDPKTYQERLATSTRETYADDEDIQNAIGAGVDPDAIRGFSPANRLIEQFGIDGYVPPARLPSGGTSSSTNGGGGNTVQNPYGGSQYQEYYGGGGGSGGGYDYSTSSQVDQWYQGLLQWNINRPKGG